MTANAPITTNGRAGRNRAQVTANPMRAQVAVAAADPGVRRFHRRLPGYSPTPLYDVPELAARLGVKRLLVKSEARRLGLNSFKILGASWATYVALTDRLGAEPEWTEISELTAALERVRPLQLVAATDGNHGRAVAFLARMLDMKCEIFVPARCSTARRDAIRAEGAEIVVVEGTYGEAVRRAARRGADDTLVIADTASTATDPTAGAVIHGYSTLFDEIDEQLEAEGLTSPNLVVVPVGVGSLMAAATAHYRQQEFSITLAGVEPLDANSAQRSTQAGAIVTVPGPHHSIMAGLNCDSPSGVAWPLVSAGTDWFISIPDEMARDAMRDLATHGIVAGETGAASLAGLRALRHNWSAEQDHATDTVLLVVTEGATDPTSYEQIVGHSHTAIEARSASRRVGLGTLTGSDAA